MHVADSQPIAAEVAMAEDGKRGQCDLWCVIQRVLEEHKRATGVELITGSAELVDQVKNLLEPSP